MLALVLAALAALLVGLACAAQNRATHEVDRYPPLHPGLVVALARRPWWVVGTLASVAGLGLQIGALALGAIIVVQCVMTTSLAWTLLGDWLFTRRRPALRALRGVALVAVGLVGLLLMLAPAQPAVAVTPGPAAAIAVVGVCTVIALGALACSRRARSDRSMALAVATGIGYGITAALLKLITGQLREGWTEPLHHPALYLACLLGPAAILLSQNALQRGRTAAPAVTVILLLDPVIGLVTGTLWFGERVTTQPVALLAAVLAGAVAVAGVLLIQSDASDDTRGPRTGPDLAHATAAPGVRPRRGRAEFHPTFMHIERRDGH